MGLVVLLPRARKATQIQRKSVVQTKKKDKTIQTQVEMQI